jgi:putative membrane protein
MKNRELKDYLLIATKGIGMGAADVVPGVSGGTIAMIVGVYQELIDSIKSIDGASLKLLLKGKIGEFWKAVNGTFLLSIVTGILISVFSLAKIITYLLAVYPILVWAFFFGLVMASTLFVAKEVERWNWKKTLCFIIGAVAAFYITVATPAQTTDSLWFVFLCGAIAICAMILPGISGSFILVLLGKYDYVLGAVKSLNVSVMIVFACGALLGITSFSHLLSYVLKRYHDITIAVLSGFMLGSLNKVWPWKEPLESNPLMEANKAPDEFVWQAITLMVVGFGIVYVLEMISAKSKR